MEKPVNLVIFCSRESVAVLSITLLAALRAAPDNSVIDILVNGNKELASQMFVLSKGMANRKSSVRVWYIPFADKGNAWNQHVHEIWQGCLDAIYIDGYVRVAENSIRSLSRSLAASAQYLGASGVPSVGWSAKTLRKQMDMKGGFHGNLCAITSEALERIKDRGIRIPIGMYRVDGLMGAFLSFGLNPNSHAWNPLKFIAVVPDATWQCDRKKWYRLQDILAWGNRRYRQARGDIENSAIKYHLTFLKCQLEELPSNVTSLVAAWAGSCPSEAQALITRSPRHRKAMVFIRDFAIPEKGDCVAYLVGSE